MDAFVGIIGALSELAPGELGLFQVLFHPVRNRWTESILRSVTHEDGKPFFVNMPELVGAAEKKVGRPLYAAVVRTLVRTQHYDRTLQIARDIAGSLRVFISPQGNALVPTGQMMTILWKNTLMMLFAVNHGVRACFSTSMS